MAGGAAKQEPPHVERAAPPVFGEQQARYQEAAQDEEEVYARPAHLHPEAVQRPVAPEDEQHGDPRSTSSCGRRNGRDSWAAGDIRLRRPRRGSDQPEYREDAARGAGHSRPDERRGPEGGRMKSAAELASHEEVASGIRLLEAWIESQMEYR